METSTQLSKLKPTKKQASFIKGLVTVIIVLVIGGIFLSMCSTTVKPGYAGVVYNMNGGVQNTSLGQGWHLVLPWKHVTSYPVSRETVFLTADPNEGSSKDDSFMIASGDGQPVRVGVSYTYHYDIKHLGDVFTEFRGVSSTTIELSFIRSRLKPDISEASSQFTISDIYGAKRSTVELAAQKVLEGDLAKHNMILDNFGFTDVIPDANTLKAIQDKVKATQELQRATIVQQQATIQAETVRIQARGQADAAVIAAKGLADANAALVKTMTPELVRYKQVEVLGKQADAMAKWPVSYYVQGQPDQMILPAANTSK
jgi:regulator of protease activity HflC (stomatin/prohibitin superfamily)